MSSLNLAYQSVPAKGVGTIIAALIRNKNYRQAVVVPDTGQYVTPTYYYHTIPMTAKIREAYQYQAEVTNHAVETGSLVSDHVILRPLHLELSFVVGNADGLGAAAQRASDALREAINVWETRQYFDLITTHRYLRDMVCTNINAENEAPEWGALEFRATFQQVWLADLQTVAYDPDNVQGGALNTAADNAATAPGGPANGRSVVQASPLSQKRPAKADARGDIFKPYQSALSRAVLGR